jgi:carbamoyltransferase
MDLARSIQVVTEEIVLKLAKTLHVDTGADHLCLAGGVALNCVANGRLLREGPYEDIWIQPAAGDAGGAVGAAMAAWHQHLDRPRHLNGGGDAMRGAYLGPEFSDAQIAAYFESVKAPYVRHDETGLLKEVARHLANGKVIGWFQGRMEFGPRALGGRSIIGDPRNTKMQSVMNLKIKYRESFRPFAPSILAERVDDWFELDRESPYMLLVAPVVEARRKAMTHEQQALFGIDKLNVPRSDVPAITHVDYSARVQTVHAETNPRYHALLTEFDALTGCPLIVNTSFNVRGEPIVCTPEDAYKCFMRTEMDYLAIGNQLLSKSDQPESNRQAFRAEEFELD